MRENRGSSPKASFGVVRKVSTLGLRHDRRFDFWRSLFPRIDLDPVDGGSRRNFRGNLLHYAAPGGATFGVVSNDDTIARFARPDGEFLMLSVTVSGSAVVQRDDAEVVTKPGAGLLVVDGTRPITSVSHNHGPITLTIPRKKAVDALGGELDFLGSGFSTLPSEGLSRLLASHLHAMAVEAERLDGGSFEIATRAAVDMGLGALAQARDLGGGELAAGHGEGLFAAARRYIHLHCPKHDLSSAEVARAIGCSRAHLYRVFSSREASVGDTIRAARLARAMTMLVATADMPIQLVAHHCGYSSPASFSRVFSAHTGMTPGEYRDAHSR